MGRASMYLATSSIVVYRMQRILISYRQTNAIQMGECAACNVTRTTLEFNCSAAISDLSSSNILGWAHRCPTLQRHMHMPDACNVIYSVCAAELTMYMDSLQLQSQHTTVHSHTLAPVYSTNFRQIKSDNSIFEFELSTMIHIHIPHRRRPAMTTTRWFRFSRLLNVPFGFMLNLNVRHHTNAWKCLKTKNRVKTDDTANSGKKFHIFLFCSALVWQQQQQQIIIIPMEC